MSAAAITLSVLVSSITVHGTSSFQFAGKSSWGYHTPTFAAMKRKEPIFLTGDADENSEHDDHVSRADDWKEPPKGFQTRRLFIASALVTIGAATALVGVEDDGSDAAASTIAALASQPPPQLPWETSPINKRSGITAWDAEKAGYTVAFVTYLSRFLLNFDPNCQRYWFLSTSDIPKRATADEVEKIRLDQFAAFAASVEVGLQGYEQNDGSRHLLDDLVRRYGTPPLPPVNKNATIDNDDPTVTSQRRIARSARRHIALLFGMLESIQPTQEVTKLLASVDNGSVVFVKMVNETFSGYETGKEPVVLFPPPQAGNDYEIAEGRAILKPTGKILRLEIVNPGSGYSTPPMVSISPPKNEGTTATAKVRLVSGSGPNKSIGSIQLTNSGSGYMNLEDIRIKVAPPDSDNGQVASVAPILDMAVDGIEITKGGSGYAVELPFPVKLGSPPSLSSHKNDIVAGDLRVVGSAYPAAEKSSFTSFQRDDDTKKLFEMEEQFEKKYNLRPVTGFDSEAPPLPFWGGKSSSAELLRLLPAGVGLEYDATSKRYRLAVNTDFLNKYPAVLQQGSNRIIGTEFGPRGRSPIERDMELGLSTYWRFSLAGAICAGGVHLCLTPLDVVKTKAQTNPVKYPNIGSSFKTIFTEEGLPTLFTGWLPTLTGHFLGGGVLYVTTEFIRRSLSEAAGVDAVALEVPIILAAAAAAAGLGAIVTCPFESVRIRTVAQPDYAPNSVKVLARMLKEEGIGSLVNAIPIFLIRNIPYAATKFTIFDLSTERMYEAFPAAQEEIRLSLLVSLIGGILGGTAAAIISNPADAVISELKKAKSDISPQKAAANMLERSGVATFFVGLPLRMVFYSLVASLTFVVYDGVRFLLKVGPDDLKLYLDVLGGALGNSGSVG